MSKQQIDLLWDLQGRQAELRRHVMQLTSQINLAERERSILDVTVRELDAMSDDTNVYMSVGKMFALSPKDELRGDLVRSRDESVKKDDGHKSLRDQFMTKLKESEQRVDEVAAQIEATRAQAASKS